MSIPKEKLNEIMSSIENRVRAAYNYGRNTGYNEGLRAMEEKYKLELSEQIAEQIRERLDMFFSKEEVKEPPEHDGCIDCKYEDCESYDDPCLECRQNYMDKYERKKE